MCKCLEVYVNCTQFVRSRNSSQRPNFSYSFLLCCSQGLGSIKIPPWSWKLIVPSLTSSNSRIASPSSSVKETYKSSNPATCLILIWFCHLLPRYCQTLAAIWIHDSRCSSVVVQPVFFKVVNESSLGLESCRRRFLSQIAFLVICSLGKMTLSQ